MCATQNNEGEKISVLIFHTTSIRLVFISNSNTFLRVLDLMQLFDLEARVPSEVAQIFPNCARETFPPPIWSSNKFTSFLGFIPFPECLFSLEFAEPIVFWRSFISRTFPQGLFSEKRSQHITDWRFVGYIKF